MTDFEKLGKDDATALDLHLFISRRLPLQNEVLQESKKISPRIDTLVSAITILGVNTVKNYVLDHSQSM